MIGDQLKELVLKRTGLKSFELECPREHSDMTPCVARDGDLAMSDDCHCVGCGTSVDELLDIEMRKQFIIPPKDKIVFYTDDVEVIRLENGYFYYRGEQIEDVHLVYDRFVDWINKTTMK
jgi:hypothetical protein